jgi:hypothetical protein
VRGEKKVAYSYINAIVTSSYNLQCSSSFSQKGTIHVEIIISESKEYKNKFKNDHNNLFQSLDNCGIMIIFNKATSNYTVRVMEVGVGWLVGQPAITVYFMNIQDPVAIQLY